MELWAWGANAYGQLALGTKCEQVERPKKVTLPPECTIDSNSCQLTGGGGHTLLVDSSRQRLFAAGWNNKGQLGLNNEFKEVDTFEEVKPWNTYKENGKIEKVACGWDFSLALFNDGTVVGCGSNTFGQLGIKEELKIVPKFTQITSIANIRIVDISCGMRHSLFLDEEGIVYATGCGKKGQLGLGESVKRLFMPTKIPGISPSAQSVQCGQHFSAVVTTSQTGSGLFMFGDNKYNQVSSSSQRIINKPEVRSLRHASDDVNIDIIKISCGWTHTVMLLSDNGKLRLTSWGRNNYGQLGRKSKNGGDLDADVELTENAIKIASGYEHVLAITERGKLYTWGWNEHSNCGVGDPKENISTPQLVSFSKESAVNCYVGSGHSFAALQSHNFAS